MLRKIPPKMLPDPLSTVSHETLARLRQYEALLVKWQKAINLVGPATVKDAWTRHFIDSAQILPLIPQLAKTLYDLGSGAGFPGLVTATLRPDLTVTLIESDQKKCAFLSTVSHETKTPVRVLTSRIEQAVKNLPAPDVVSARALASLSALLTYIQPWVEMNPNLVCIFPKGAQAAAEIEAAQGVASFQVTLTSSQTDPAAQIVTLEKIVFHPR